MNRTVIDFAVSAQPLAESLASAPPCSQVLWGASPMSSGFEQGSALGLLRTEHRYIHRCFELFFKQDAEFSWHALLKSTLHILKIHMEVEETILYPAYLEANQEVGRQQHFMLEHENINRLIKDIELADPAAGDYIAKIGALWIIVQQYLREEDMVWTTRLRR